MQKKDKLLKCLDIIAKILYAALVLTIAIWGRFFIEPGDEMGFCLVFFYFAFPLFSAIMCFFSMLRGQKNGLAALIVAVLLALILPPIVFYTMIWLYTAFAGGAALVECVLGLLFS